MANTRVSDLSAGGAFASTDIMYVVETTGVGGVKKTGTQLAEYVRDTVGALVVAGSNIGVVYDDGADTLTISFTGATYTDADAVNAMSNEVGANGLVVRSAADTFIPRSIAAGTGMGVTNGDGVSGNPTLGITSANLVAIAGLSGAARDTLQFDSGGVPIATDVPAMNGFTVNTDTLTANGVITVLAPGAGDPAAAFVGANDIFYFGAESTGGFALMVASGASAATRGVYKAARARGTLDSPAAAQDGDNIFSFLGAIYDGAAQRSTFAIDTFADGAVSSGVAPQRVSILTGPTNSRTERMRIGANGNTYFPGVGTTASAANAFLNSGSTPANELLRSTSSARYKKDIEPLDDTRSEDIIDGLRPIFYRSLAKADPAEYSYYGLLAEDVAAIDPRFVNFGYHDDDFEIELEEREDGIVEHPRLKAGAVKKPDGVAYDRLIVIAIREIQKLRERVAQLEAREAGLNARG